MRTLLGCGFLAATFLTASCLVGGSAVATEGADATPADQCVLEVQTPAGATVTLDGKNYGERRRFEWDSLAAGESYVSQLRVRFADGGEAQRTVLIQGGRKIEMPVRAASRIVFQFFMPKEKHEDDLFVTSADGSGTRRLTETEKQEESKPKLSPDGATIVFLRGLHIYLMNADGSGERPFTSDSSITTVEPAIWSPDGRSIAFHHRTDGEDCVWVGDVATGKSRRLVTNGSDPSWSLDGRRLLYEEYTELNRKADGVDSRNDLKVIDVAGGTPQHVTQGENGAWSPDGLRLAFLRTVNEHDDRLKEKVERSYLFVADPDGKNEQRAAKAYNFAWSPDGSRLAYLNDDLFIADASGKQPRTLLKGEETRTGYEVYDELCWSPDGTALAVVRYRYNPDDESGGIVPEDGQIQVVNVATGQAKTIVHFKGLPLRIDWR